MRIYVNRNYKLKFLYESEDKFMKKMILSAVVAVVVLTGIGGANIYMNNFNTNEVTRIAKNIEVEKEPEYNGKLTAWVEKQNDKNKKQQEEILRKEEQEKKEKIGKFNAWIHSSIK